MTRKKTIDIQCPFCSAEYSGPVGIGFPPYCGYCDRTVREWIIESDDDEDFEEEENPEGTYYDDGTIEFEE